MKLTIEANTDHAFLTTESGHDVARIARTTPAEWPNLESGNYLDDDQWQELIDTLHAPMTACHGLDIPADVEAGEIPRLLHACPELPDDFDTDEGREAFRDAFTKWRAGLTKFGIQ